MNHSSSVNPYEPGEVAKKKKPTGPIEFPGRQISLSIMRDIAYMVEGANRYRSLTRRYIPKTLAISLRWASGLFLISLSILALCLTREIMVYLYAPFMLLLGLAAIFTEKIDNAILRFKLKSASLSNHRSSILLRDEGYFGESANGKAKLLWTMFTDAMEFPDGVLVLQGKYMYHWLPFESLEDHRDSTILYRYVASRLNPEDFIELNDASQSSELPQESEANGPQIRLIIVYSTDFLIESLQCKGNWRAASSGVRYTSCLLLIALAIFTGAYGWYLVAAILSFAAVLVLLERGLQNWRTIRQHRSSPHRNEVLCVTFSGDGCLVHSLLQNVMIDWQDIAHATEFPDGVLLSSNNPSINWLPYRCLENQSDAKRLFEFVSSRIEAKTQAPQPL